MTDRVFGYMGTRYRGREVGIATARACVLADTLAWAAQHGIAFSDALQGLPFLLRKHGFAYGVNLTLGWFVRLVAHIVPFPVLTDFLWVERIRRVRCDLASGVSLGSTLEKRLGRQLPRFYTASVLRSEAEGTVEQVLPLLAEQMRYPQDIRRERAGEVALVFVHSFFSIWIIAFLLVFIWPKYSEIITDMSEIEGSSMLPSKVIAGMVFLLLVVPLSWVVIRLLQRVTPFADFVLLRIPLVGREWRDLLLIDLARSISVYLATGNDLLDAAKLCRETTRSGWLKRRVSQFIRGVEAGEPWLESWERTGIGSPFDDWVLRNAAAREDPAAGFTSLAQWAHQRINARTRLIQRWAVPASTLCVAVAVGLVGYAFFSALTMVMSSIV